MKIGKQERRDAKQLFRECFVQGQLDDNRVRQVARALITQKPRGYVAILEHLHRLIQLELNKRTAMVESAVPLPDALQQSVRENLTRLYGPGLLIQFQVKPAWLGGLRIQLGSDVFDGTVRSRLAALQESF